jgi:hypothetical protein
MSVVNTSDKNIGGTISNQNREYMNSPANTVVSIAIPVNTRLV